MEIYEDGSNWSVTADDGSTVSCEMNAARAVKVILTWPHKWGSITFDGKRIQALGRYDTPLTALQVAEANDLDTSDVVEILEKLQVLDKVWPKEGKKVATRSNATAVTPRLNLRLPTTFLLVLFSGLCIFAVNGSGTPPWYLVLIYAAACLVGMYHDFRVRQLHRFATSTPQEADQTGSSLNREKELLDAFRAKAVRMGRPELIESATNDLARMHEATPAYRIDTLEKILSKLDEVDRLRAERFENRILAPSSLLDELDNEIQVYRLMDEPEEEKNGA